MKADSLLAKFAEFQKNGEEIIVSQAEKYEKLIAELEEQISAKQNLLQENTAVADKTAEQQNTFETIWMSTYSPLYTSCRISKTFCRLDKVEELCHAKEEIEKILERERLEARESLKRVEEELSDRLRQSEANWQGMS